MERIVEYLRKSTDDDERQVQSIGDQTRENEKVISGKYTKVETFSESKSAKTPGKRVEFLKMLNFIKKEKINGIVAWDAKRLSRNPTESGILQQLLVDETIFIHTHSTIYNKQNWFMFLIDSGSAALEIMNLSENVTRGMDSKVRSGIRPGKAPLGYINRKWMDKGTKDIVIDPKLAPYVRRMFDLALAGKSVVEIRNIINGEGLMIPASQRMERRPIGKSQVYRLLANDFYYGYFYWKGELKKGSHKALVSKADFDKVQVLIGKRSKNFKIKNDFWWYGLVKCAECGSSITGETKYRKTKKGIKIHSYARCTKKLNPSCTQKSIVVDEMDKQIRLFLTEVYLSPVKVEVFRKQLAERNKREFELAEVRQTDKNRRLQRIFEEKKQLYGMKTEGLLTEEKFLEEKNKLVKEEASLESKDESLNNWLADAEKAANFASKIKILFDNGDAEVKKDILRIIGSPLVYQAQKVWRRLVPTFEQLQEFVDYDDDIEPYLLAPNSTHESGTTDKISSLRSG